MSRIDIRQADALNLAFIPDNSIDLVVTSPPYFSLRKYTDGGEHVEMIGDEEHPWEYVQSLVDWMGEMWRVLKNDGNVFVVLGDKYAGSGGHNNATIGADKERGPSAYSQSSFVAPEIRVPDRSRLGLPWLLVERLQALDVFVLRAEIIWEKPSTIPTNARNRVELTHETILHFTKTGSNYASDDLWEQPWRRTSVWRIPNQGMRIPADILTRLDTDKHYAAFPPEIPYRAILGWCPPSGVVLDPFGGAGTTALVCKLLARDCISTDLSAGYVRLARWRVHASDHARKLETKWVKAGLLPEIR